jgi:predicted lipoprotein with Yx(FWY)xxD motif
MKRMILLPVLAVAIASAVVVVAVADNGSGSASSSSTSQTSPTTSSTSGGLYGSPAPAAAPAASPHVAKGGAARIATASHGVGTMLVDARGRSVYLWKGDTGKKSMCSGACAQSWPPVTTKGAPKAGGGVKASLLGTSKRSGETTQVTYAGHPLYTFAGDSAAGQLNGQDSNAFGAVWQVVAPNGKAITRTAG